MHQSRLQRISQELHDFSTSLGSNSCQPTVYAVTVYDQVDHLNALIVGPPGTPYSFGFYQFDVKILPSYPTDPPKVTLVTTDGGKVRFNPNLYAEGKVCLSILGTWNGTGCETWQPSFTVEYVLSAIQALVLNQTPYHNEPGYEMMVHNPKAASVTSSGSGSSSSSGNADSAFSYASPEGNSAANMGIVSTEITPPATPTSNSSELPRDREKLAKDVQSYSDKIRHENLRVAVCDVVEAALNPESAFSPFRSLVKHQFLLYYETYLAIAQKHSPLLDRQVFLQLPFEYSGNTAEGSFQFAAIADRLQQLREKVDLETDTWRENGRKLTAQKAELSLALKDEFKLLLEEGMEGASACPVTEDNALVWEITLFGPVGTMFQDSVLQVELIFPPEDPSEIPRMRFLTPMFHPNVSPSGYLWFNLSPGTIDSGSRCNVQSMVAILRKLLLSEPNPSPAAWLNEEAANLCFSKDSSLRELWRCRATRDLPKVVSATGVGLEEVMRMPVDNVAKTERYYFRYPRRYQ